MFLDDEKSEGSVYENHAEDQIQLTSTPSVNNLCDMSEMDDSSPLHQRVAGSLSSNSLFVNPLVFIMLLLINLKILIINSISRQLSSSQLNFFRLLDEKIEMVSNNQLFDHFFFY